MSQSNSAVVDEPEVVEERPAVQERGKEKTKKQPPHAVILHNDDVNGADFVIEVICKVFHYERVKAFKIMQEAHTKGRAVAWSGMLEVAELKADQIRACGPDPIMKAKGALALRVSVEALPG